jgi:hypothetical protein
MLQTWIHTFILKVGNTVPVQLTEKFLLTCPQHVRLTELGVMGTCCTAVQCYTLALATAVSNGSPQHPFLSTINGETGCFQNKQTNKQTCLSNPPPHQSTLGPSQMMPVRQQLSPIHGSQQMYGRCWNSSQCKLLNRLVEKTCMFSCNEGSAQKCFQMGPIMIPSLFW